MKFSNYEGKKNRLSKYLLLITPILFVLGLFGYLQLKTYKANRLVECVQSLDIKDIYSVDIFSKKDRYWNHEYKRFNGSKANDMLVMLKEQNYKYFNFMDKDDFQHSLDKYMYLEIITLDKNSLKLIISINDDTNRAHVIVDGNTIYNSSAVYELPYDDGTQFYESLIKIAWEE